MGDKRSNNTNRLVQVAQEVAGSMALRVDAVQDLQPEILKGKKRVAVIPGVSTPSQVTREVIHFIESFKDDAGTDTKAKE